MTDPFVNTQPSLTGPATAGFAVAPDDAGDLPFVTRALYVGGAGNLTVRMLNGETLSFAAVPAGSLLPLRVRRVAASGTTATQIVALY